jgi:hypothetical protein
MAPACSRPLASRDGGDASPDRAGTGSAGTGGMPTAGSSGGTGSGGTFGTAGATGGAGASGTAGGAGGSAPGGRGGAGGSRGPGPECATASDCKLVDDCCTCAAIPIGATAQRCSVLCNQNQCGARQLRQGAVDCVVGRCVAGFACDASQVTCRVAPPSCPAGEVPSIDQAGNCYTGACAPASECTTVTGCGVCLVPDGACVSYQTRLGTQNHCVTIPPECGGNAGCDCLGSGSCLPPYGSCGDYSGIRGIFCSCPNC